MDKYCQKCNKLNHKSNKHCGYCGNKLTTSGQFGKNIFAITLSVVILLFAVTAFAGKTYFNNKAKTTEQSNIETKKNQDLVQQQIDLQKKQLDLQAKQIEDAKKNATATTPPATTIAPKATTPTCDETKQERQRKFYQALLDKAYTSKVTAQARIEADKGRLLSPTLTDDERESISKDIGQQTIWISDADYNSNNYKTALDNISKCKLYDDKSLTDWGKVLGVAY